MKLKLIEPFRDLFKDEVNSAFAPQSVVMTLTDDIDISRGDFIAKKTSLPLSSQDLEVMICWFSEKPLQVGGKYLLKQTYMNVCSIIIYVSRDC